MNKLRKVYLIIFLKMSLCLLAQTHFQNYISNGGFDSISVAFPNGFNLKDQDANWDEYTSGGSFLNNNYLSNSLPNTSWGYQNSLNGQGLYFIQLIGNVSLGCLEAQSYIQYKLKKKLLIKKKYRGRFYASLSDSSHFATSRIGMYISANKPNPIYLQANNPFITAVPQIQKQFGFPISDKLNWIMVEDTFQASMNMMYMTFGNFYRIWDTDTFRVLPNTNLPSNKCQNEGAAYFIDNLSLVEEDRAEAYKDTSKNYLCIKQGTTKVLGDTAVRPWLQYSWRNKNNTIVGTTRNYTYNAAFIENTFFTVEIKDTGEYAFITKAIDTIFIYTSVSPDTVNCEPVGLQEILADAEEIEMFYNENSIKFTELHERFVGSELVMKSIDGKVMYKTKLQRNVRSSSLPRSFGGGVETNYVINIELQKGFYFVDLIHEGVSIKRKKIILE
jgi:hypothetical protein